MKAILQKKYLGLLQLFLLLFAFGSAGAQVSIGTLPYSKSDNFDTYNPTSAATTASTLPAGWSASGAAYQGRGTGTSNSGGFYAYGSTEYSLGALRSGTNTYTYTVSFTNNSGSTITSLTLAWAYEQWRFGGNTSGWDVTGTGELASNAILNAKDFSGVATGSAATSTPVASFTLTGLEIASGESFGIKWATTDLTGSDNGVAIDNFSLQASGAPALTSQTISFNTLGAKTYGDAAFPLSATATSGLTVAFVSSNTAVATVSGTTVTIVGAGSTNITASQAGNSSYSAAPNVIRSLTVNKKELTLPDAVASDKIYNGNAIAAIVPGTISGIVNSDALTIGGNGTFASKNVANGIAVTPNLTLAGTKSASYLLVQPTGLGANISPKLLTVANAAAGNKVFDGNTDAVFTGTLTGVISPDDVTLSATAAFDSPFAGTQIPVNVSAELAGAHISNYTLGAISGIFANITPKEITIANARALHKIYDGNVNAQITGTLEGVIAPDEVTLNTSGFFSSPEIALNVPVTSTSTITGDVLNYILVQPTGLSANITAAALIPQSISFENLADAVYGDAALNLAATATSGLGIHYESLDASIAVISGNVLTITGTGTVTIVASQPGDGTYDAALPVSRSLTVTPKELSLANAAAADKIYDGNTNATITGTLSGIAGTDEVGFSGSAAFASPFADHAVNVHATLALTGPDAAYYTIAQPQGLTASINPKEITISGLTIEDKIYDKTTTATINGGNLNGIVGQDDVAFTATAAFETFNAGQGLNVEATFALEGTAAANYSLLQPSNLKGNITKAPLTIGGLGAENKVYNRNISATLNGTAVLEGIIDTDAVTLSGNPTAVFINKNAGISINIIVSGYTLNGLAAANYTLQQPLGIAADILKAPVTIANATALDKTFDATTAAAITGTVAGVIAPDAVTLVGTGTFATSAVGNSINVTSTATLAGTDGANYTINPQPTGLTANILTGPSILQVGDLSIIGMQVNAPDTFAFVSWVPLNNGTVIKFTDNGFLSSASANAAGNVRGGENFIIWKNNGATIAAGTVIIINDTPTANFGTIVSGNLNGLSGSGDAVFAYQGAAVSGANPDFSANTNPATFNGTLLFGLQLQGSGSNATWLASGVAASTNSYLPSELNVAGGNMAIASSATRAQYNGPRANKTTFDAYKTQITDSQYWNTASGSGTTTFVTTNFTLASPPTASVLSVSGPDAICAGQTANLKVDISGGTAAFNTVVYTDGTSNFTVTSYVSGRNIPVSPSQSKTYTLVSVTDSNLLAGTGNTGSASITVTPEALYYEDADGDGYGNPDVSYFGCIRTGFVANHTDCDDQAGSVNPGAREILYDGIDNNCDGQLDENNQLTTTLHPDSCGSTLTALTSLIRISEIRASITGYRIKITHGGSVQTITKTVPFFTLKELPLFDYAVTYTVEIELQRNGIWLGYYGAPCLVSSPAVLDEGGAASVSPSQCGSVLPRITTLISTTSLPGATGYRFRVTDVTPGGSGEVQVLDRNLQFFALQMLEHYNYNAVYRIEVAVKTTGNYSNYGGACEIYSPKVDMVNCGSVISKATDFVKSTSVNGAAQYRFQITKASDASSMTIDRGYNYFTFNMIPGYTPGAVYLVRTAVMTTGSWSVYGDACEFTAPGGTVVTKNGNALTFAVSQAFEAVASPNPFAAGFTVSTNTAADEKVQLEIYDMLGRLMESTEMTADLLQQHVFGNGYPSGIYNVIVNQGEKSKILRLIKR